MVRTPKIQAELGIGRELDLNLWRPWDADDDEQATRRILRDGLPSTLKTPVLTWIADQVHDASLSSFRARIANPGLAMDIQSTLQVDLDVKPSQAPHVEDLVLSIARKGDKLILRVVDLLLAGYEVSSPGNFPQTIAQLAYHFDANASSVEIAPGSDGTYRLRRRVTEGVEEIAQEATNSAGNAGKLLAEAWRQAYALEPNPSEAMTLAIRAVEAAGAPVVVPRSKKGFIGEIAQTIEDQGNWQLNLRRSEGYPDHNSLIALMLRTLAKAQGDRHGDGDGPSPDEATSHVQLAATLVSWFANGTIQRANPLSAS